MKTFSAFAGRITRGYALLACALIILVVLVSTILAFVLYAGTLDEAVTNASQRATAMAAHEHAAGASLSQTADAVVARFGRGRVTILVFDSSRHLVAGHPQTHLLGFRRRVARIAGGAIVAEPNLSRLLSLLLWYWSIVLPIGAIAVVVAWLVGRTLTRRALDPLENVTQALGRIAAGDFTPEPLPASGEELGVLTSAYNEVAYRLTAATTQHREDETRMRQFIADAGHELRTPLTVIMGYLDMLCRGAVRDDETRNKIHETMHGESHRMRAVIEKLLLLARLDRPFSAPLARLDASAVTRRVAAELAPLAGDRIAVDADPGAFVDADEPDLYEAVKNVIDNAVRYAPQSPVAVRVSRDDAGVTIEVRDEGDGIGPADIPFVFERFYRGKDRDAPQGSGLGLAIAKKAVERFGGTIAIRSARGEGTTATLRFPPPAGS
ncbi:MAG: sensor histidine kinase [Candidatus Tyrphobacter sp.]